MADGAKDGRLAVRSAAVTALSHSILDKHALSVPAAVMSTILKDVLAPVTVALGRLLEAQAKEVADTMLAHQRLSTTYASGTSAGFEDQSNEEQLEEEIKLLRLMAAREGGLEEQSENRPEGGPGSSESLEESGYARPDVTEESSTRVSAESLILMSNALSSEGVSSNNHAKGGPAAECLSALCKVSTPISFTFPSNSTPSRLYSGDPSTAP